MDTHPFGGTVIRVDRLVKRYDGRAVVNGVSLNVERGEIFGVLGPNGAGKTTLVEMIAGLRTPDEGTIDVLGMDPRRAGGPFRERLGCQLQESRLPDRLKVWEAMDLYASFYPKPRPWPELLERLGMGDQHRARFGDLSGGQKQRLSVALALVGDPEIAILDELTTGLDPQARRDTWDLIESIRDDGVTIVLVSHFMEEVERLCDRLALIDGGELVAVDTPSGLVARVDAEQRIRFKPSQPFDHTVLSELPEVTRVEEQGSHIHVTGTGNLLHAVVTVLVRHHIVAEQLRFDQPNLDDAFVALTGRTIDAESVVL
ncbi:MAG: ABC transporter ATP-binding protein [Acidimicrobiia bacterium]